MRKTNAPLMTVVGLTTTSRALHVRHVAVVTWPTNGEA